jgi:putative phage-type endonuclease
MILTLASSKSHKDRETWLEARKQGIGGSEAAAVLGISPWVSPLTLYLRKLNMMPEQDSSERMQWGLDLEDAVAAYYERETGRKLYSPKPFTIFQNKKHPFMQCTIDRLIEQFDDRGPGVVQIKTAGPGLLSDWQEELPLYYQVQIQHEMAVMGYAWGSLAVFFGDYKGLIVDVNRNDRFTEILVEKEGEFWDRIQNQDPPPVDDSESSKQALHFQYSQDSGETIPLPGDALHWDEGLQAAKTAKKIAEKEIRELENKIKEELGFNTFGVLPNGTTYTWKAHEREGYWVEATTIRVLRRKR